MKELRRLEQVKAATGLSRSSIYRLEGCGQFPRRCPLGGITCWSRAEIAAWCEARLAERDEAIRQRAGVGERLKRARAAAAA